MVASISDHDEPVTGGVTCEPGREGGRFVPDCEVRPTGAESLGCADLRARLRRAGSPNELAHVFECYDVRVRCTACKGRGRTRKPGVPPGFANGDSIARTARRLLDTLDGRCPWAPSAFAQASMCGTCNGTRARVEARLVDGRLCSLAEPPVADPHTGSFLFRFIDASDGVHEERVYDHERARLLAERLSPRSCPDCRGTGHNLSGVLPEVEHPRPRVLAPFRGVALTYAAEADPRG